MIEIGGTCLSQVKFKKKKQNESQKLFRDSFNICAFFPISFYFFYIFNLSNKLIHFSKSKEKAFFIVTSKLSLAYKLSS